MRHKIASAQRLTSGVLPVLFTRHHRPRAERDPWMLDSPSLALRPTR